MKRQILPFKLLRRAAGVFAVAILVANSFGVSAAELPDYLVPVGRTAGIKLLAPGVVVADFTEFDSGGAKVCPAKAAGLKVGDIILSAAGRMTRENAQLSEVLKDRAGQETALEVLRGEEKLILKVTPAKCSDGAGRIGAAVRDSMAGIGTVTYYDPKTETFGALGHGICASEKGEVFPLGEGCLVPSAVVGVKKGLAGAPGELIGVFEAKKNCGNLMANTERGIFGSLGSTELYPEVLNAQPIPVGNGIKSGKATILANISGGDVTEYEVEIVKTVNFDRTTKNFLIRVTDPVLLDATGGIVQGM